MKNIKEGGQIRLFAGPSAKDGVDVIVEHVPVSSGDCWYFRSKNEIIVFSPHASNFPEIVKYF